MSQVQEYDLKKSQKLVGQLYPILLSKDGQVLDGLHRIHADRDWERQTLEHIDSEEKKLLVRLVANFHRRHVSRDEKAEWINSLAELYHNQGLQIEGARQKAQGPNQILYRIVRETGLGLRTVREYLDPKIQTAAA